MTRKPASTRKVITSLSVGTGIIFSGLLYSSIAFQGENPSPFSGSPVKPQGVTFPYSSPIPQETSDITEETRKGKVETPTDNSCREHWTKECSPVDPTKFCDIPRDKRVILESLPGKLCRYSFPPGVSEFYPKGVRVTYRLTGNPDQPLILVRKESY